MKKKRKPVYPTLLLLFFYFLFPSRASAGAPTEQIRASVDKVLAILRNPQLKSAAKARERRDQLRQVVSARFDFAEMARRSLGSQWRRLGPKEQEEFVWLFTDLLERAYLNRIESFSNETIVYSRENVDKNFAELESRIVAQKGEEISIHYKAYLVNDEWKVYDVVVENISLINNYRSQFSRVITNSSYEELVRRMKEKQIDVAGEKK